MSQRGRTTRSKLHISKQKVNPAVNPSILPVVSGILQTEGGGGVHSQSALLARTEFGGDDALLSLSTLCRMCDLRIANDTRSCFIQIPPTGKNTLDSCNKISESWGVKNLGAVMSEPGV